MAHILTNYGEEWMVKTDIGGEAPDVGLYNDSTDNIGDGDDVGTITTEPGGGNYSRSAGVAVTAVDEGGDWGITNDGSITFDVTNTSGTVDSYFFVATFDSEQDASGAVDHLVFTGALSQSYDLSNLDTLEISAGTAGVTVN